MKKIRIIDVDALKMELQSHFDVVEQDCNMSDEYREGVIAGLDAAMFEIDSARTIDAIPVEWLNEMKCLAADYGDNECVNVIEYLFVRWQEEQEAE